MKTGIVGWRGMVGSVLMERMRAERDFDAIEPVFFSTSQAGGAAPNVGRGPGVLHDANDLAALAACDVILTCQGGDYTNAVHPPLRAAGWKGYWIDAASALRMKDDAVIILDPVNRNVIDAGLRAGGRDFIGGNCTVSLMMMALGGLFRAGLVESGRCWRISKSESSRLGFEDRTASLDSLLCPTQRGHTRLHRHAGRAPHLHAGRSDLFGRRAVCGPVHRPDRTRQNLQSLAGRSRANPHHHRPARFVQRRGRV